MIDGTDDKDVSHSTELMPPGGRFETSRRCVRIEEHGLDAVATLLLRATRNLGRPRFVGVTTSGLVVRVGGGVIPSVATYDRAFHSLILDRPITTAGILKLLGEIVELFLELVGHGVFAVAHPESVAGAPTRAKAKVKLE